MGRAWTLNEISYLRENAARHSRRQLAEMLGRSNNSIKAMCESLRISCARGRQVHTLCWECARAAAKEDMQCSWSRDFTPVEGWDAREVRMKAEKWYNALANGGEVKDQHYISSYRVNTCPMFLPDKAKEPRVATPSQKK